MNHQKFYKYKEKYLNLKKIQSGGNLCNLSDWTEISNNGQNNCGIFIHKTNPEILMKCGSTIIRDIDRINQHTHTFPIQYEMCNIEGKKYLIMERLDNDITHIYFNLLPKIVLENMNLSKKIYEKLEKGVMYQNNKPTKTGVNRIINLFDIGNNEKKNEYIFSDIEENLNYGNTNNLSVFETQSYCNRKNSDSEFSDMDINVETKV